MAPIAYVPAGSGYCLDFVSLAYNSVSAWTVTFEMEKEYTFSKWAITGTSFT